MTTSAIVPDRPRLDPLVVQQVLLSGDLSKLNPEQRVSYYNRVCESLGLNPLTQPFAYLRLSGREVLYAKKDATDQLRFIHQISIDPKAFTREVIEGVYIVTAAASMPNGRTDVSTGAVPIDGLKGEARANAIMKGETKAKRRVTLSICGLGMLDETEIETIPQAAPLTVDVTALPSAPEGVVYLAKLEMHTSKKGREWADVVDSHGEIYMAYSGKLIQLLEQVIQEKAPVVLTTKKTPKGFTEITKAVRWAPPTTPDAPVEPPDVSEIPF